MVAGSNATANEPTLFASWQQIRANDYKVISVDQKVLLIVSWLLAMLAIASIAVVAAGAWLNRHGAWDSSRPSVARRY